ncbi:MAG TPA: sugar ABC transporter ATP-binding protein [Opitutaceae bacterium]|nr:sugar ABC transporter ATP-binding protein [Opitutaceae bacterium]
MPPRLLQLSGIGKSFGANRVLEGVCFDLHAGEVHVLAGENGAGKSTLIKVLAGIHGEYDGSIELAGRPVRFASPQEAGRQGISVIHQEMSLVDAMSVADNIFLGRELARRGGWWLDRGAQLRRAHELCRQLDLELEEEDLARPVGQFPLSVKNRIEIAKALCFEARILVMDEPTSALNRLEVEKLFVLMDAVKRRSCGIIYITHKMEEIYRVADRITVLRDGKWVGTAPVADCPESQLIRWMIGRELSGYIAPRAGLPRSEGMQPRLEVRNFHVPNLDPSRSDAVRDFSVDVGSGEIVGIAGLQGSGSTELFQGLFGAYGKVCRGKVRIDGEPFRPSSPRDSIRRGLAYLTADRKGSGLIPAMSVASNMSLAALPRVSPGGMLRRGTELAHAGRQAEALHIRLASLDQAVGTLSGGNQQKVVLAKWLETEPRVLLLEEPTRGVDVGAKQEIYALMRQWTAAGMALLLISTELPELLGLSDRIVVMHRGEVTGTFGRGEATPERILAAAMGAATPRDEDPPSSRAEMTGRALRWRESLP